MYEGMYADKTSQLKKALEVQENNNADSDEFEVIQQQDLMGMTVPEDNYDFLDRDLDFDAVAPEYE